MHERYHEIYERFRKCFPSERENIVDWYPSARNEIIVLLRNGDKLYFSGNNDRFGYIGKWNAAEVGERELDDDELRYEFSVKLMRLMQDQYMNQRQLSEATGISSVTINHYITGRNLPDFKNLRRIANALGCSVSELTYFE